MGPILERYQSWAPKALLVYRGDSGFAVPELFDLAETKGHKYAIRLKANARLQSAAQAMANQVLSWENYTQRGKNEDTIHYRSFLFPSIMVFQMKN